MDLLYEIISKIADREGVDPMELDLLLNETVNVEALEALIADTESQREGPYPLVEFVSDGYTVRIGENRNVSVSEATATDGRSTDGSNRPRNGSDRPTESVSADPGYRERAMRDVADVISARERPFDDRLAGLLEVVRKALGVESATLSYVDNGSYVFEAVDAADAGWIHAGAVIPLENTTCKRVVESEQRLVLGDIEANAPELATSDLDISSYLGVPVFVDGEVYGTLCFYDRESRDEAFSEWDIAFVELLRNWVSSELERRQRERAVHASTTDRPYTETTAD
jgi:hypothetical protein